MSELKGHDALVLGILSGIFSNTSTVELVKDAFAVIGLVYCALALYMMYREDTKKGGAS